MITVTWNDGVAPATSFTISDEVAGSLDQFRQTITSLQGGVYAPTYATVQAMIVGIFVESIVMPALTRFPTASIQTAQANLAAAQTALAAAQAAALPGLSGGGNG